MKKGFDTKKYLDAQTKAIIKRVKKFNGRLYLEFGGKLCYDAHAARVLPGYEPDTKIKIFQRLKEKSEIAYCIGAKQIQQRKIRGDFGSTYDEQALREIKELKEKGIKVSSVVITRFEGEEEARKFKRKLENYGNKVYLHYEINGYPTKIEEIVSEKGFGRQDYIEIEKPIIIVTGAGGGSGKMEVCLSQLYHDRKQGIKSGYAKFETFPVWNLPIDHPINIAYEAATADIGDVVMIDPFHLQAYKKTAVNYNRDIENFQIMQTIIKKIVEEREPLTLYQSPTDMGVSQTAQGIINDEVVREASGQEIIRRFLRYSVDVFEGREKSETLERMKILMNRAGVKIEDRKVVLAAKKAALDAPKTGKGEGDFFSGAAIELANGKVITGKNSPLLHAESAAILNAIKTLASIPDEIDLISAIIIKNISQLKQELGEKSKSLDVTESLIALAMSATTNPTPKLGLEKLKELRSCEMHTTHIPLEGDKAPLRKIGVNLTSDTKISKYSIF
jgi:uncharacterized protein (UPF0371 family)